MTNVRGCGGKNVNKAGGENAACFGQGHAVRATQRHYGIYAGVNIILCIEPKG
jgi:hypothetical protein